jgi:hypothetical protein
VVGFSLTPSLRRALDCYQLFSHISLRPTPHAWPPDWQRNKQLSIRRFGFVRDD